jgi:peptidoglycan-associated lipoprotein
MQDSAAGGSENVVMNTSKSSPEKQMQAGMIVGGTNAGRTRGGRWIAMTAAAIVALGLLSGCRNHKPISSEPGPQAPTTDVNANKGFGDEKGASANPEERGDVKTSDDPGMSEIARELESKLHPIYFAFDRYELTQESRDTLTANAAVLRQEKYEKFDVWIEGHCDERGTNEYNLALGDRRARAARDFLVTSGVTSDRLTVISYGEEKPVATGHDEASWSQNRRDAFAVKGMGIGG